MKRRRSLVVAGLVATLVVLVAGSAGAASARRAGADTISVQGSVLGNEQRIVFGLSGSPIVEFRLDGGPTFHITQISSPTEGTGPGRPGPKCSLTPSNFGGLCDFATPVTNPRAIAWFTGQTPTMVAGSVIFGDGTTGTFTAPITIEPPGKPTVSFYARGMKRGQPRFYFSLSASEGAPWITGFTVTFPHGLSLLPSTGTLHEHWTDGVSFTCTRQRRHRIGCHTETPFAFISPHFGPSTLVEGKALETLVKKKKVRQLPITVGAIDVLHQLTYLHVPVRIQS